MSERKEGIDQKVIKQLIRKIPNSHQSGTVYHDITPIWKDYQYFDTSIKTMVALLSAPKTKFDVVVAIEAAGWIYGSAIAYALMKPFVPVVEVGTSMADVKRSNALLPSAVETENYEMLNEDDGKMHLQSMVIHKDALEPGQKVVIVDEMIATGKSAEATAHLIEKMGGTVEKIIALFDIEELGGCQYLKAAGYKVGTCVTY
ncbi:hypothetical protein J6Z37_01620 [Candidatus Saccharibacteria bacterium]|nr:hypothetical protein [Candidatus Saccharibacteria bacterium]